MVKSSFKIVFKLIVYKGLILSNGCSEQKPPQNQQPQSGANHTVSAANESLEKRIQDQQELQRNSEAEKSLERQETTGEEEPKVIANLTDVDLSTVDEFMLVGASDVDQNDAPALSLRSGGAVVLSESQKAANKQITTSLSRNAAFFDAGKGKSQASTLRFLRNDPNFPSFLEMLGKRQFSSSFMEQRANFDANGYWIFSMKNGDVVGSSRLSSDGAVQ